jgi:hypothetical protein
MAPQGRAPEVGFVKISNWGRTLRVMMLALVYGTASMSMSAPAAAQDSEVTANMPPPDLPVYDQPPIPADGYVWTPGYWAWSDDDQDYFWVPGTWVPAPQAGYLWTPGYWGMDGAVFLWHPGYWATAVGFYGGINYGYGYTGYGYEGGYWQGGRLYYNRSVTNITNVNVTNVYNKTIVNNVTYNHVSYNGGNGVQVRPTPAQLAVAGERHVAPTPLQRQHVNLARGDASLRAAENQGHPPIAATSRPTAFRGPGVVSAREGGTLSVVRPNERPPAAGRPASPSPDERNVPREQPPTQRERAPAPRYDMPRNEPPRNEPPRNEPPRYVQPREEAPGAGAPREVPHAQPEMRPPPPSAPPPHQAAPPPPPQHPASPPQTPPRPEHEHEHGPEH